MDIQKIVPVFVGVVLIVGGYFVARKILASQNEAVDSQPTNMPVNAPSLPSYTPTVASYTPIGAITSSPSSASAPPGVNPSDLSLSTVVVPASAPPHPINLGTAAANAPPGGTALQPTDAHSSAPALTGNAALIDSEYLKLFGRHAEQAGLDFWGRQFDNGGITSSNLERTLIRGAQNEDIASSVIRQPGAVIASRT